MLSIRRILFPTDFSGAAEYAWSQALTLAQKFKAEVHLLHVVAPPPGLTEAHAMKFHPEKMVQSSIAEAAASMDQQVEGARASGRSVQRPAACSSAARSGWARTIARSSDTPPLRLSTSS